MKKSLFLLGWLMLSTCFVQAQKATIQFGDVEDSPSVVNCADENYYYSVDLDGTSFECQKMGKKFESISTNTIESANAAELKSYAMMPGYTYNPNSMQYLFIEGDFINVIYSVLFKKQDKISFFHFKIKKSDLKMEGSEKEISTIQFQRLLQLSKAPADILVSPDNTKILFYSNIPGKKADNERFHLIMFDRNMEKQWDKEIDLGFTEDDFNIETSMVDNEGTLIIIGKEITNKKDVNNPLNFKRHIYTFSDQASAKSDHLMDAQFNDVQRWNKKILKDGKGIVFAMNYEKMLKKGSKEKPTRRNMLYFYDYKNNSTKNYFLNTELTTADSMRFQIDAMVETNDNHLYLIYEKFETTPGSQQQGNVIYTWTDYYYDDIKIEKIDMEGNIKWSKEIVKSQETRQSSNIFGSYGLRYINDKLYIYYNDHAENKVLAENADQVKTCEVNFSELPQRTNKRKKETVTEKKKESKYYTHALCEITADGTITKEILSMDSPALLVPSTRINNNGEIILNYFDQESFGLCKIIFK